MRLDVGDVKLRIVDLQRYERTAVYTPDRTTLQYVRQIVGVQAEYSPGGWPRMPSVTALSDNTNQLLQSTDITGTVAAATGGRGANPGAGTAGVLTPPVMEDDAVGAPAPLPPTVDPSLWRSGPETDTELRNKLMQPRQRTILWAYDRQTGNPIRWLESPRGGPTPMVCDATGGPYPISCDVIRVEGEPVSVSVYYQFQTDTVPCPNGSDRMVLSHRWQVQHGYDDDFYLTRTTIGEIVFNAEYVVLFGITPDQFRNQFLHPVPLGFKRGVPVVEASPDGFTIRYVITDTDPTIMFDPADSGATQMQIVETLDYQQPIGHTELPGQLPSRWRFWDDWRRRAKLIVPVIP